MNHSHAGKYTILSDPIGLERHTRWAPSSYEMEL